MSRPKTLLPLRVTARLESAVVTEDDLHLDAILHWVQAKRVLPGLDLSRASDARQIQNVALPLARIYGPDGRWVWAASAWDLPDGARIDEVRCRGTKRKDAEDVEQRARNWTPRSGPERDQRIMRQAVLTPRAVWLCVGHPREVRKALKVVDFIGSMRRHGYGCVTRWDVDVVDDARLPLCADGFLARNVPWGWVDVERSEDSEPGDGAVLPPYWHPGVQEDIALAGWLVTLRDGVDLRVPM